MFRSGSFVQEWLKKVDVVKLHRTSGIKQKTQPTVKAEPLDRF